MDYVIDIQGFHDKDNCFVAKEVAVVALDKAYIGHWIISPTYVFTELPKPVRAKNNWTTRNHHGLEWFEGDVALRTIHSILREITRTAGNIFTRGREKASYLQNVTAREIKNLEDTNCPSFTDLPSSEQVCLHHGLLKRPNLSCALNNAAKLKEWILSRDVVDGEPHIPTHRLLPELTNVKKPGNFYSPVATSDEYDPDWPGLAGVRLDSVRACSSSRSDSDSLNETDGSSC